MGGKRREFSSSFKPEVASAAAKGAATLAALASRHRDYPNQISAWKKLLLEGMSVLFEVGRKRNGASALRSRRSPTRSGLRSSWSSRR